MYVHLITPARLLCASAAVSLLLLAAGCGQQSVGKVVRVDDDALTISETSYLPNEEGNEVITTFKVADDTAVLRDGQEVELLQLREGDAVSVTSESRDGESVATKIEAESVAEPAEPIDPVEPIDPAEPIEPVEPIDPAEPDPGVEPMPQEPMPQEPIPQEPIPQEPIPQQPLPQDPAPQDEPAPKLPGEVIDPAIDATQQRPGEEVGGTLVSVSEDSIVVHDKTGLKHSFAVAGDAMITLDGEEAALADLGADVEVRVKIEHRDDTFVVTHIDATTPE